MRLDEVAQQPGMQERLLAEEIMTQIHVSMPGTVTLYNPENRTVSVQLADRNPKTHSPVSVLKDVPVFFPGNLIYPVNPGDECLVVFADKCIDGWFLRGDIPISPIARKHDLSDGFALIGFFNTQRATEGSVLVGNDGRLRSNNEIVLGSLQGEIKKNSSVQIEPAEEISLLIAQNGTSGIMYSLLRNSETSISACSIKTNSNITVSSSNGVVTVTNNSSNDWKYRLVST